MTIARCLLTAPDGAVPAPVALRAGVVQTDAVGGFAPIFRFSGGFFLEGGLYAFHIPSGGGRREAGLRGGTLLDGCPGIRILRICGFAGTGQSRSHDDDVCRATLGKIK